SGGVFLVKEGGLMGMLGGLNGILWLLPASASLGGGPQSPAVSADLLHFRAPTALTLSNYSAENSVLSTGDRFRIARARSAMLVGDLGAWSLSITGSRARSAHEDAEP